MGAALEKTLQVRHAEPAVQALGLGQAVGHVRVVGKRDQLDLRGDVTDVGSEAVVEILRY